MKYSFIVPVYNRPDEVDELLESLCSQSFKDFEVIIVEDGSKKTCKDVCDKYADILDLHYYYKDNSGPGQSRNYGAERAQGEWLIILDSDVVLPPKYLENVECRVESGESATAHEQEQTGATGKAAANSKLYTLHSKLACFGGPDAAHPSFTPVQKAISYSMTSFFTTGGIRGGSSPLRGDKRGWGSASSPLRGDKRGALDKFYPRSFNMGIRRDVYLQLGGFSKMRFGEDIDFSYRIVEAGYQPRLFPDAWVWHKRRTDFRKFFRQVYNSGIARINLKKRHPGTLKLVHLLPTIFTLGVFALILVGAFARIMMVYGNPDDFRLWYWVVVAALAPIFLYSLIILIDSTRLNRSLKVGFLSIPAAFTQLMGYGLGFIEAWWKRCILKKDEFQAFEKTFYS